MSVSQVRSVDNFSVQKELNEGVSCISDSGSSVGSPMSVLSASPSPSLKEPSKIGFSLVELRKKMEEASLKMVQDRRDSLLGRLQEWKKDLSPYAPYCLSYIPGLGGLDNFLQSETTDCIESIIQGANEAKTLSKLVKVEKEAIALLENGKNFVDSTTFAKFEEGQKILQEEIAFIGSVPEKNKDASKVKTFPKVAGTPELAKKKVKIYEEMKKWKADFTPTPTGLMSKIQSISRVVEEKTEDIYSQFISAISSAKDEEEFTVRVEKFSERLKGFTVFLGADSATKLEEGLRLLDTYLQRPTISEKK